MATREEKRIEEKKGCEQANHICACSNSLKISETHTHTKSHPVPLRLSNLAHLEKER